MKNLVIFQNYYTPYRSKLFHEIGKDVDLTVVYLQKPQDEGRKWKETEFEIPTSKRNFKTLQLECKNLGFPKLKLGPVVWPSNLSQLDQIINKESTVIFLDNLPTNIAMNKLVSYIGKTVPAKQRVLWVEHIAVPETVKSIVPFYRQLKSFYKTTSTFLLAFKCDTILTFSEMSVDYCKKLGLPLKGQKILRTYQATYTEAEIASYRTESEKHEKAPNRPLTFGFLGYFTTRKGLAALLQAIKYSPNLNAKFLFVGDGPEKKSLIAAAEEDARIEVLDYASGEEAKTKMFLSMDIHVVPSDKDPWCLVVNEAAARGVPSLVSPNVGAKEMMKTVSIKLILENNQALTITKALLEIEKLWQDKKAWNEIKEKTYDGAMRWSVERAGEAFNALMH